MINIFLTYPNLNIFYSRVSSLVCNLLFHSSFIEVTPSRSVAKYNECNFSTTNIIKLSLSLYLIESLHMYLFEKNLHHVYIFSIFLLRPLSLHCQIFVSLCGQNISGKNIGVTLPSLSFLNNWFVLLMQHSLQIHSLAASRM